jgi:hypothetical protein
MAAIASHLSIHLPEQITFMRWAASGLHFPVALVVGRAGLEGGQPWRRESFDLKLLSGWPGIEGVSEVRRVGRAGRPGREQQRRSQVGHFIEVIAMDLALSAGKATGVHATSTHGKGRRPLASLNLHLQQGRNYINS